MLKSRICVLAMPLLFLAAPLRAEDKANQLPAKARAVLEKAETFDLLSLDPAVEKKAVKEGAYFGWKVLGKTTVKDADTRKRIVEALLKGIEESDGNGAKCFDPRHGISAKHDGQTVDLVVCFECSWVYVFLDGKRVGTAVTTRKPQAVLDKVLTDAKVALPKGNK